MLKEIPNYRQVARSTGGKMECSDLQIALHQLERLGAPCRLSPTTDDICKKQKRKSRRWLQVFQDFCPVLNDILGVKILGLKVRRRETK